MATSVSSMVIPGDFLGKAPEFVAGEGAYVINDEVRASLTGTLIVDEMGTAGQKRLSVRSKVGRPEVIVVGDTVLCRVVRTTHYQAFVDIVAVGDTVLPVISKGTIRKEDISSVDVDNIVVQDHFKGKDIVRASVISLGDAKLYYLSTAGAGLGIQIRNV
jgi:exosome complex component CSL4